MSLLIHDGAIAAATPSFLGANPAASPLLAGTLRPLGGAEAPLPLRDGLGFGGRKQGAGAAASRGAISGIVSGNRARVRPGTA